MLQFINAHTVETVILVTTCVNFALSATSSILETIIKAKGGDQSGSQLGKIDAVIVKGSGYLKTLIDWISANRQH